MSQGHHVARSALVGAVFVLLAGLSWSFTGAVLRLAPHLDSWQILFFRGLGVAVAFAVLAGPARLGYFPHDLVRLGGKGMIVLVALALSSIGFIVGLKLTTVANTLFLASCSPLLSAVFGYVFLRERLNLGQIAAVALGLLGLVLIICGGFEAGSVIGNLAAFCAALGFAVTSVIMRQAPNTDFAPSMIGYGLVSAAIAAAMAVAEGATLLPPADEAAAAFVGGFLVMGLGFTLFLRGAPLVPAVGQTVLAQTETVFGPIWVWLAFGEEPSRSTLVGGAVILVAVIAMAFASSRGGRVRTA